MTVIPFPGTSQPLIERAGTHACAEIVLPAELRFTPPVTDLDIARLMYALESGTPVVAGGPQRWTVPDHSPLMKKNLARIVDEALRFRLVWAVSEEKAPGVVLIRLEPAAVHFGTDVRKPMCDGLSAPGPGPRRYRVSSNWRVVDCAACLQAY